jgi:uncharacterized protein
VGWKVKPSGLPGIEYTLLCIGDHQVAGVMSLPAEQMPPRSVWFGYIGVDDVDAKAAEAEAAGGTIHKPPQDIPEIGRFAVLADPLGAVFLLFKGASTPLPPLAMMQPGSIGWHELHTTDWEKAWPFYERLFGWTKDQAFDLGPIGTYQLFKSSALPIGGMMTESGAPHPFWLYYFVVDDIDAALARVRAHGGTVLTEPREVPGGAWIISAEDPQGGLFALVGMRKA